METLACVAGSFRPGELEIYAERFGRRHSRIPFLSRRHRPAKLRAELSIPRRVLSERQDAESSASTTYHAEVCSFHGCDISRPQREFVLSAGMGLPLASRQSGPNHGWRLPQQRILERSLRVRVLFSACKSR